MATYTLRGRLKRFLRKMFTRSREILPEPVHDSRNWTAAHDRMVRESLRARRR